MRIAVLIALLLGAFAANAEVTSFEGAFEFIEKSKSDNNWFIATAKHNDEYVQCFNNHVTNICTFAVYVVVNSKSGKFRARARAQAPDAKSLNDVKDRLMSDASVAKLKAIAARYGLKCVDVYSDAIGENDQRVGELYDVDVIVPNSFAKKKQFAEEVFKLVRQSDLSQGVSFEVN